MKTTIKNRIYLVVMIGMSVSGCFASDGPYNAQGLVPGGYGLPLGIEQLPVDNSASLTPVYTGSHNSQLGVQAWESVLMQQQLMNQQEESRKQQKEWKKKEAERIEQIAKDRELAKQLTEEQSRIAQHEQAQIQREQELALIPQAYKNYRGIAKDKVAEYYSSNFWLYSFFKTHTTQFCRKAENSKITLFRCGNTYKDLYQEDNVHSNVKDFSLFNTYEKGCLIRTPNGPSYRFLLSIGDVIQEDETSVYTKTSDSTTVYISRDMLGALMITGLALKYGAIGALSMITGMAIKGLFVVPVAIGGAILFPVFATIGGSIVLLGITLKTAIAGATLVALTPNAASLICLYLLANRYARG